MKENEIINLLEKSYSPFHVVKNIKELLESAHFEQLTDLSSKTLFPGHKYFITANDSSLIAFKIPNKISNLGILLTAAHTDSPTFKVKPNPVIINQNVIELNVEPYGGMIYSTWLDRPLSLAGRIYYQDSENQIKTKLVNIDENFAILSNSCIHLNSNINNGFAYNPAKDLIPIIGLGTHFDFKKYLKQAAGLNENSNILSFDLFLYNRLKPTKLGINQELLASGRLDDLASTYSSLYGFIESPITSQIQFYVAFDNEEVGSKTRQGANSTFLKNTINDLLKVLNLSTYKTKILNESILLSIDNAHATHPNYPELMDITTNINMGKGIVIKYNANQSYTTDALSSSIVKLIANKFNIPYQEYTNKSNLRGGSTLGNISNSEISLISADIGIAQLAMHSSYELCALNDVDYMYNFVKEFYSSTIKISNNLIKIL